MTKGVNGDVSRWHELVFLFANFVIVPPGNVGVELFLNQRDKNPIKQITKCELALCDDCVSPSESHTRMATEHVRI